jgi:hypothetical protein
MSNELQGWQSDPWGRHEERYFSAGKPTAIVRDGAVEGSDPFGLSSEVPSQVQAAATTSPSRSVQERPPFSTPSIEPAPRVLQPARTRKRVPRRQWRRVRRCILRNQSVAPEDYDAAEQYLRLFRGFRGRVWVPVALFAFVFSQQVLGSFVGGRSDRHSRSAVWAWVELALFSGVMVYWAVTIVRVRRFLRDQQPNVETWQ